MCTFYRCICRVVLGLRVATSFDGCLGMIASERGDLCFVLTNVLLKCNLYGHFLMNIAISIKIVNGAKILFWKRDLDYVKCRFLDRFLNSLKSNASVI